MAVNFYDVAYDLENALRGSEEFTRLKNLYDEVNADESAKRMFENFRDVQLRLQQKQMAGEEITEDEVQQAQKNRCACAAARKNLSADGSGAAYEYADRRIKQNHHEAFRRALRQCRRLIIQNPFWIRRDFFIRSAN